VYENDAIGTEQNVTL